MCENASIALDCEGQICMMQYDMGTHDTSTGEDVQAYCAEGHHEA